MKGGRVGPGYERGFESLHRARIGFIFPCIELNSIITTAREPLDEAEFSLSCLSPPWYCTTYLDDL